MRIWRRLGPRILAIALVLSVFGTVGINLVMARVTLATVAAHASQLLAVVGENELGRLCARSPQDFYVQRGGLEVWALDDTYASSSRNVPELPEDLLKELKAGADHASALPDILRPSRGMLVQRVAQAGPCAIFVAKWSRPPAANSSAVLRLGLSLIVAGLGAFALGLIFVVRPLTSRIQDLKDAAARVGGGSSYTVLERDALDELDEVRQVLDRAHSGILRAAHRLEDKNRALVTHLSDVAHDLRTPIAALQLKLERLGDDELSQTEREDERIAALADALYLEALCENLRFAATLREGLELESAQCDLNRVVLRVRDRLGVLARQRGVSLDVAVPDEETIAPLSRVVFERILSNLVANAVVHRDGRGGHVAVVLERRGDSDRRHFSLRVIDDGPGLPADVHDRLTNGASAAPVWSRDGGTGLGLRIVSALCVLSKLNVRWLHRDEGGLEVVLEGDIAG